jgi:hypothetical protein
METRQLYCAMIPLYKDSARSEKDVQDFCGSGLWTVLGSAGLSNGFRNAKFLALVFFFMILLILKILNVGICPTNRL